MIENIIDLKLKNIKDIINTIRLSGLMSRKQLAEDLGLSFATVSNVCNSLIEHGVLIEDFAKAEKTIGRTTKFITLNKDMYKIIGISMEGAGVIRICLSNLKNEIISQKKYMYQANSTIDGFVEDIASIYFDYLKETGVDEENIIGIGIALSAVFSQVDECIVSSEISILENQPLKKLIEARTKKTVFIDNDANLCIVSVKNFTNSENIVYLYINIGLGIGTIQKGKVTRGERGFASEICHMPLGLLEKPCWLCGSSNCLQTDISKSGFAEKFSAVKNIEASWDDYIEALNNSDDDAVNVARENAVIIGKALSSVVNLLDSEKIIIGGIPKVLFDELKVPALKEINDRKVVRSMPDFKLIFDDESYEHIISGATEAVFDKWCPNI